MNISCVDFAQFEWLYILVDDTTWSMHHPRLVKFTTGLETSGSYLDTLLCAIFNHFEKVVYILVKILVFRIILILIKILKSMVDAIMLPIVWKQYPIWFEVLNKFYDEIVVFFIFCQSGPLEEEGNQCWQLLCSVHFLGIFIKFREPKCCVVSIRIAN